MPATSIPWELIVSALGGGGVAKAFGLVFGRKDREVKRLADALDRTDARMERFEERLDECHENHEACERARREDREEHARKIAELEAEVRKFMAGDSSGEVAPYVVIRRQKSGRA